MGDVIILRYSNRKLYRKDESRYLEASELVDLIKHSEEFKVFCYKTKKDITLDVVASHLTLNKEYYLLKNYLNKQAV